MLKYLKMHSWQCLNMMKTKERHLLDAFYAMDKVLGTYIHIPYCKRKCYYCDFLSCTDYEGVGEYIGYLLKEIDLYKDLYGRGQVDTIYFGGGTPSSIDPGYIGRVMDKLGEAYDIGPGSEITIEVNPESVTREKIRAYKSFGINRVSMGCQSFDDEKLRAIGRIHDRDQIYRAHEAIKSQGIDNINLDLIFALPGQTLEDFDRDLDQILSLEAKHISAYSLILEEGTKLEEMVNKGSLRLLSDDEDRDYYGHLLKRLDQASYVHYEVSNFAKAGYESRHNLRYWELRPYIGLGLGSSSFYQGTRYSNYGSFQDYYRSLDQGSLPIGDKEELDLQALKIDYILMQLRLIRGIDRQAYRQIFQSDFYEDYKGLIDSFVQSGHMEVSEDRLAFTRSGLDISNRFFVEII